MISDPRNHVAKRHLESLTTRCLRDIQCLSVHRTPVKNSTAHTTQYEAKEPIPCASAQVCNQQKPNGEGVFSQLPSRAQEMPPEMWMRVVDFLAPKDVGNFRRVNRRFRAIADQKIPQIKENIKLEAGRHAKALVAAKGNQERVTAQERAARFTASLACADPAIPGLMRHMLTSVKAAIGLPIDHLASLYASMLKTARHFSWNDRYDIVSRIFGHIAGEGRDGIHLAGHELLPNAVKLEALAALYSCRHAPPSPEHANVTSRGIEAQCRAFARQLMRGYISGNNFSWHRVEPSAEEALELFRSFCQIFPHGPRDDDAVTNLYDLKELAALVPEAEKRTADSYIMQAAELLNLGRPRLFLDRSAC